MSKKMNRFLAVAGLTLAVGISVLGNTGVVEKILAGDRVRIGGSFVARLTGIAAPPTTDVLGREIHDFTKRELEGKTVKFFTWTKDDTAAGIIRDENGNPFVQIYYGEGMSVSFNEVLLKKGYAKVDPDYLPENLRHYLDLEREAREKGLGIWADR